jgi:hypothetical protein
MIELFRVGQTGEVPVVRAGKVHTVITSIDPGARRAY